MPLSPSVSGKTLAKKTHAVSSVEDLRDNYLNEVTTDALPAGMVLLASIIEDDLTQSQLLSRRNGAKSTIECSKSQGMA